MSSPASPNLPVSPPSFLALSPLLLFIALFCGVGFTLTALGEDNAFYQLPAAVALVPALALALWFAHRRGAPAFERLLGGMGDKDVQLMLLIFLLSGAFTAVSRATGGVEAVVALGLSVIPAPLILPGIFLLATAIALALGTSMGTIAAVAPIALGLADAASLDKSLVLGAVLSGATCGDNLSVISDTAIAAARTQGTTMRAKFLENLKFAVPAALGTLVLLAFAGDAQPVPPADPPSAWLALPYLAVLVLAVLGVNVLAVLAIGVVLAGAFGLAFADYGVLGFTGDVHQGFLSVTDTVLVSLFVAGLGALIRADGGFAWFVARIEALARGRRARASASSGSLASSPVAMPCWRTTRWRSCFRARSRRTSPRSTACRPRVRPACSTSSPASPRACCRGARRSCSRPRWAASRRSISPAACTTAGCSAG